MNLALIVAAGRGLRVGGPVPKQYAPLGGAAILRHTALNFLHHPEIHAVQVIIHPNDADLYESACAGLALPPPIHGGAARHDSVRLGLEAVAAQHPDHVLIHDSVRPFVSHATITAVLAALGDNVGAIAAMALSDTLKRGADGLVAGTLPRAGLFRAQTPQGFRYTDILAAYRRLAAAGSAHEITDDAMVAEQAGIAVRLVEGSEDNFKITTPADLHRAAALLTYKTLEGATP